MKKVKKVFEYTAWTVSIAVILYMGIYIIYLVTHKGIN